MSTKQQPVIDVPMQSDAERAEDSAVVTRDAHDAFVWSAARIMLAFDETFRRLAE